MKVLLWKIGALGDVLMTTPLVRQLRRALPDAQIDYLVGAKSAVVLRGNPCLSRVLAFDETILYERRATRLPEVINALKGYDIVYVLDKHWIFALVAWLAGVPRRIGFQRRTGEGWLLTDKVRYGPLAHEVDYYLRLLQAAGTDTDPRDVRLQLPPPASFELPPPYSVFVNSGGRNAYEQSNVRRMPSELFRSFVLGSSRERHAVFVGTADEHAYYEGLAIPGAVNLCGQLDLPQVWSVLQRAEGVYSTDCGLMHMAAAVNDNVVCVFGPTHPVRKCPPGARFVWGDEARYDAGYELFGRLPRGRYFQDLTVAALTEQVQPSPHGR